MKLCPLDGMGGCSSRGPSLCGDGDGRWFGRGLPDD
jgi:hypothetical protein